MTTWSVFQNKVTYNTHRPVWTVLALTHLPSASGGSTGKYRTITSSHGPQRVHLISSWSRDLTCHSISVICDCILENRPCCHKYWNPFFACRWKSHSCTIQRHQALESRWPGLLLQAAVFRRCKTTRVHFIYMAQYAPLSLGHEWMQQLQCFKSQYPK